MKGKWLSRWQSGKKGRSGRDASEALREAARVQCERLEGRWLLSVTAPRIDAASDTGPSNSDNITNDANPVVVGRADAGTTVQLFDTFDSAGPALLGTAAADAGGNWNVSTHLAPGNHVLTATQMDAAGNFMASAATTVQVLVASNIATDKSDYPLGSVAHIAGDGFYPNEYVTLQVLHTDGITNDSPDNQPWTVQADANGHVAATWDVTNPLDLGSSFSLTAIGQSSGWTAQAHFTDSTITISANTLWSAITTGTGPGGQPSASDTININAGATLTVDVANGTALAININTGTTGTGTLLFNAGGAVSVTNLTQGGTGGRLGNVTMTAGGSLKVTGMFTYSNGTFTGGTGTFEYGGAAQTIENSVTYANLLTSGSGTKSLSGTTTVSGSLTIGAGTTLDATTSNRALSVAGAFTNNGTFNARAAQVTLSGAAQAVGGTGTLSFYDLLTSGSGTKSFASAPSFGNNITVGSGTTLDLGAFAVSVVGDVSVSGALTSSGTLTLNNAGTQNIGGTGTTSLTNLTTAGSNTKTATGALSISGNLTIGSGTTLSCGSFTHTLSGNLLNSGTLTGATGTFALNGVAQGIGGSGTTSFNNLTTSGTTTVTMSGALTVGGALTIGVGTTFDVGATSFALGVGGNFTNNGTFNPRTGTVTLSGATQTVNASVAPLAFYNLSTSGSGTKTANVALSVQNNLTVGTGTTFNAGSLSHTVTGNVSVAGTFTGSTSTVTLNGAAQTIGGTGTTTFNLLTLGGTGTKTLGGAVTVAGDFTIPAGLTLDVGASNFGLTLGGDFTVDGVFTPRAGTVTFNGGAAQAVGGAAAPLAFNSITVSTANTVLTTAGNLNVAGTLTVNSGAKFSPAAGAVINSAGAAGTIAGSGTIQVTRVLAAASYLGQYKFVTNTLGSMTVEFVGAGDQTIDGTVGSYGGLTTGGTGTKSLAAATTVAGAVTIGTGTTLDVTASNFALNVGGNFANSGTFNAQAGTLTLNGGTQSITSTTSPLVLNNLSLTASGTKTAGVALSVAGNLSISAGTLSAGSFTHTVSGNVSVTGTGTLTGSTSTFQLNGVAQSVGGAGTTNFNNLTLVGTTSVALAGTVAVGGNLTIPTGASLDVTASNFALSVGGNFSNAGTFNARAGTLTLNGGTQSVSSATSPLVLFNFSASGGTKTMLVALDINGTLALSSSGVFNAGAFAHTLAGNLTVSASSTFSGGSSTFTLDGAAQTIGGSGSSTFGALDLAGTGTKTLGGAIAVSGNLTIESGVTLDVSASNFALSVGGNFANAGTFTQRAGTVTLNGTTQSVSGANTFSGLTISTASAVTLVNGITVTGALSLGSATVSTGANTLVASGTLTRTTGFVIGNLQKPVTTGTNVARTFEVGSAGRYTPVTATFASVTAAGNVTAGSTASDHPSLATSGVSVSKGVNRYWTLTAGGGLAFNTVNVAATFVAADQDAGVTPTSFTMRRFASGAWSSPSGVTAAALTTTGNAFAGLGDFAVGQANTLPTASIASLLPAAPSTNQVLTATVTRSDADGDAVTLTYVWKVNGVVKKTTTATTSLTDTFDLGQAGNGDAGDTIAVEVTPSDGQSGAVQSASVVVGAAAPVVDTAIVSPASPTTRQILGVAVTSHDDDGNPVTYTYVWKKNGTPIAGETGSTLDLSVAGNGDKGDAISVVVTPHATTAGAGVESAAVIVADTAPVADTVSITPSGSPGAQILNAIVTSHDDDADAVTYTYVWKKNGVAIAGQTAATLDLSMAGNCSPGDGITVTATPNDGTLDGGPLTSGAYTVPGNAQTISFGALANKTYGDASFTLAATSSSGLAVSFSVVSGPATVVGDTLTITGAGTVVVRASQAGDGSFGPAPDVDQSFDVAKKALTPSVTVAGKVYDGTNSAGILSRSLTGVVGSDDVTLAGGTATFADRNVGVGKTVSVTGLSLVGARAANYTLGATGAAAAADITPRPLTVTVVGIDKVYDGTAAAGVTLADDRVGGDALTVSHTGATFADKNAGAGKMVVVTGVTVTGADAANYTTNIPVAATTYLGTASSAGTLGWASATTGFGTIHQDQSIKGNPITIGGVVYARGIGTHALSQIDYNLNGAYQLFVSDVGVDDDSLFGRGSVRFKVFGDGVLLYDSGDLSGGGAVGHVNVSVAGVNVLSLVSEDAGDGIDFDHADWAGARLMSGALTGAANITPRPLTITAAAQNKVYDGTTAATATTTDNHLAGDSLTVAFSGATFADKNAGAGKTVTLAGLTLGGADAANYSVAATASATASVTPRALLVSAVGQSKVYDGTPLATVGLTDDRIAGDAFTATGSATFADKNVGAGKSISVTGIVLGGPDAPNYVANTSATTSGSITPRALLVSAIGQNKVYDGMTAAAVTLADDRVSGDALTLGYVTANFADKNAGTAKAVQVLGIGVTGADAGNYTFNASATASADITPRLLTLSASGGNKTYDGGTGATVTLSDDRIAGDVLTVTAGSAAFADKNAGIGKPLAVAGITLSGPDAANYTCATSLNATATIAPRALHVTAVGQNKAYDGTTLAAISLADDHLAGDNLSLSYDAAAFADKNAGANKNITVSGIHVSGADAGNYIVAAGTSATATIAPRLLTVTAQAANKIYDGTTAATVTLADDRVAGDALSAGYTAATFADKNVGTGKTVGVSGISLAGPDAGNYTCNAVTTTTADITPRALTVTASASSKPYDGTTAAAVTLGDDRLAGDALTLSFTSAAFADKNVGAGKSVSVTGITLAGDDAINYTFNASASASADITPRVLHVAAAGVNKVYDRTVNAAVVLSDDRVAGDVITVSFGSASFADKNAGAGKLITVSGVTASGADAANYAAAGFATATADITPRQLHVTAVGHDKDYDGTNLSAITLADDRLAGDALTATYANATFGDKNVGIAKSIFIDGIVLAGADAANYAANDSADATATITPRALHVTAVGVNKTYDGSNAAAVTMSDDRVAGDDLSVTYASAAFADKNAGTGKPVAVSDIMVAGGDAGNYAFNATASATADVAPRALTVTAAAAPKVYDGTTAANVTLADDRVTGDVLTANFAAAQFADRNAGTGKLVTVTGLTLSGADAGNYVVNLSATATADITRRALHVTAAGINKVYNGLVDSMVNLADDRVAGDLLNVTYGSATFADKNVGTGKPVIVSGIALAGADADNYTFNAAATTTADITRRALTIVATGIAKTYDGTTAATVTLADDRIAGDDLSASYASAAFADKNAGLGKSVSVLGITLGGADAGNYTSNASATASADVSPRTLLVTAHGINKVYDGGASAQVTFTDDRIAGDVVSVGASPAAFANKNVGLAKAVAVSGIALSGADAGNYAANPSAATTADITARVLTVTAHGVSKIYDGTDAAVVTLTDDRVSGDDLVIGGGSASFADKNVGLAKSIALTGLTLAGADAGNYTFNTNAAATADITPRALHVTAAGVNKTYDGTASATVTLADDRVAGDVLVASYVSAAFADKIAGAAKSITVAGISLAGGDAGNYTVDATAPASADIARRALVISATATDKVYDGTAAASVTLADDRIAGDVFSASYGSATFADKIVGAGKPVSVVGITLGGADAANYTFNTIATASAAITPRVLVVTGSVTTRTYDGTAAAAVSLSDDRVAGDAISATFTAATFADKNAGAGKQVTISGVSLAGADAANYVVAPTVLATGAITARPLTIGASAQDKPYDGNALATVTLSDDRVAGDVFGIAYTNATFADKNVGTAKLVTVNGLALSGPDAANYGLIVPVSAAASITPELLVTGTAAADTVTLVLDASGQHIDWFLNGSAQFGQMLAADLAGLTITSGGASDLIVLDYSNGNPLPHNLHLNGGTFTVSGLQGTDPLADTTLEIGRSTVFVAYPDAGADPVAAIRDAIVGGYANGTWAGTPAGLVGAITSLAAKGNPLHNTAVGYADYGDGTNVNLVPNTVMLKYAVVGDTDLDGAVGLSDYTAVVRNFGTGTSWTRGAVTYGTVVGLADYTAVVRNFAANVATLANPATAAASTSVTSNATSAAPIVTATASVVPVAAGPTQASDTTPAASTADSAANPTGSMENAKSRNARHHARHRHGRKQH